MDFTPKDEDSVHVSSSFETSATVFESTPKTETELTPSLYNSNPKKRKAHYCDIRGRKLDDLLELCPTPQASSTLNESLTREFENIKIEPQNYYNIDNCDGPSPKFLKTNGFDRFVTPPSTPESHLRTFECTPKKAASFQKCSSACSVASPFKEQRDLLYPTLKPLEPVRKPLTPQKFKEKVEKFRESSTPNEKCLFQTILDVDVVMGQIFQYLSNGELYRVSMVSKGFRNALYKNTKAFNRYSIYKEYYKKNKENYKITPPSSPESQSLFPEGSVSPNSQNFAEFTELGSNLNPNQSLTKCPKCDKPSVVEKSIAQCQEVNSCGYIFCQKCDSYSYDPKEFYDRCRDLGLGGSVTKKRGRLEDLTNCSLDFNVSSILNSTAENQYLSSGYFSGTDTSHTPVSLKSKSVKRNLSTSFGTKGSSAKPQKALFDSNRSLNVSSIASVKREVKRHVLPIVKKGSVKQRLEVIEPSSPPRVASYSACSEKSRKYLRRLTR